MTSKHELDQGAHVSGLNVRRFDAQALLWAGVVFAALVIGLLNLLLDGNLGATLGLIFIVGFVLLSIFRPSVSVYALIFLALAVEQITQVNSWTARIPYYRNLNNILPSLSGLAINPLELHFACIILGLVLRFIILRPEPVHVIAWKQLFVYVGVIFFFVAYGLIRGGEFFPALWETRGIIYLVVLMLVVPQVIRTEDQVRHTIWAIIAGLGSRAIEVTYLYVSANFSLLGSDGGWGNHEDSGMLGTMIVFTIAMVLYKANRKQRIVLLLLAPLMLIAIVASDRRTAYPVMAAGLLFFLFIQPAVIQKRILQFAWKAGIVFAIYLAVFWESSSQSLFVMPVRSIREGFAGDNKAEASDSYTSNLYRKVENYDLQRMITERPLLGTGYGSKIEYYLPLPLGWDLGFYMTHNQILCVLAKTGMVGFAVFIFFYLSIMSEIAFAFGKIVDDKYLQAVLVLTGAAVVNHLVFSFFDIVLTYYRNNVYLGVLFGLTSTIVSLHVRKETPAPPPQQDQPQQHWLLLSPPAKDIVT